ncbi:hypothetical protein SAMN04487900_1247 [Prevotella communis]|uniref:Uncharacterized protein n=1 Tax=Prevotella communis TaxID=2913614 RepID=A0A1H0K995_9BACT|nr:hypothetical protein SAMN04487900_1247 [Prevotella communis]
MKKCYSSRELIQILIKDYDDIYYYSSAAVGS